jgi:hypothetical protein
MDALDGNAIAGQLFELFGREMTTVVGVCGHCGVGTPIAEQAVYLRAPGAVVRCRSCGQVVMVLTDVPGSPRVHLGALTLRDPHDGARLGTRA